MRWFVGWLVGWPTHNGLIVRITIDLTTNITLAWGPDMISSGCRTLPYTASRLLETLVCIAGKVDSIAVIVSSRDSEQVQDQGGKFSKERQSSREACCRRVSHP